ncbi:uncharacterized protein LOC124170348 [Ischnura elegans]|uniref:uncharacterized protein LOC124170348 n=1 Tax=Ischnura elegans TaxID=197161 RepID=UPI001ED885F1|nr:uncharacterized protein LOC124170348 [Ischnura elegans]
MPYPVNDNCVAAAAEKIPEDWLVACKHTDGLDETVRVHQLVHHKPWHDKDFNPGQKYLIKSKEWSDAKDKYQLFKVYICRIAENEKALNESIQKSRLKWPVLRPTDSDALGSESEVERARLVQPKKVCFLSYYD